MKQSVDVAVLVAVLGAFLLLNALLLSRAAGVARRTEIVPVPSTYRTTPSGAKALYELLARLGVKVGRLESPWDTVPAAATVLVVLEPALYVTGWEASHLRDWVDRGGTLVLASQGVRDAKSPVRSLGERLFLQDPGLAAEHQRVVAQAVSRAGLAPQFRPGETLHWRVDRANRYLAGVRDIVLDPAASSVPGPAVLASAGASLTHDQREWPVAGDPPLLLCTLTPLGRGCIVCLPTAALLANGQLSRADNAVFATNLIAAHANGGRVLFDEYHLGGLGAESLWAVAWRLPWRWVTVQLLAALVLLAGREAIRFGPAVAESEALARRPAAEYVVSLAGLWRRAGARREVAGLWLADVRRSLARAAGLPSKAEAERVCARLAQRAGLPSAELRELLTRLEEAASQDVGERALLALVREAEAVVRRVTSWPGG